VKWGLEARIPKMRWRYEAKISCYETAVNYHVIAARATHATVEKLCLGVKL
jgi:hypothetical protein